MLGIVVEAKVHPSLGIFVRCDGYVWKEASKGRPARWDPGYTNRYGYKAIAVQGRAYYVHRLVAETFIGEAPSGCCTVDHINRVRSDNRVENLRWASYKEQAENKGPTAKALFLAHIQFFKACRDLGELKDKVRSLAQGDAALARQLHRYYKQLVPNSIDARSCRAAMVHHGEYEAYAKSCKTNHKGKLVVDKRHYYNAHFRSWCRSNGLHISLCSAPCV